MPPANLAELDTWDPKSGLLNVVIETPKGDRNKFKYDPETGTFELCKVLPAGSAFPFDFGFIPSTVGDDGDPLDVLVLMEEPVFPGCRVHCRLAGVIEAEQRDGGEKERNDRLLAIAEKCKDHEDVKSIKDLNENLLKEIEHFFASYHELDGKKFKPLARHGPNRAMKLVREGVKRCGRRETVVSGNGKHG